MTFYQDCGDVKRDLLKVLNDFFEKGIVNGITNETYVCLIPNKQDAIKVKDFRPISLITSMYKIIAKVLSKIEESFKHNHNREPMCFHRRETYHLLLSYSQ